MTTTHIIFEPEPSDTMDESTLSPIRPVKRSKSNENNEADLPAVMWGAVMNYLEFSSVVSMTATSRAMRDAVPFVSELHIHESCQMHVSLGRRFKGVRDLFIYSFLHLREPGDEYYSYYLEIDPDSDLETSETSLRAVPFVSSFTSLKTVYFGAIDTDDGSFYQVIPHHSIVDYDWSDAGKNFATVIDSFSVGFRSGLISQSLELMGLSCLHDVTRDPCGRCGEHGPRYKEGPCKVCPKACQSFPIAAVAKFECSSVDRRGDLARDGHFHNLLVCLKRDALASCPFLEIRFFLIISSYLILLSIFKGAHSKREAGWKRNCSNVSMFE